MRGLMVFAAVVSCCVARPDIGLKLREQGFNVPSTNYGVPTGGYLPPTGGHQQHYYESHGGGSNQVPFHTGFGGSQQSFSGGGTENNFNAYGSSSSSSGGTFESSFHGSHSSQGSTIVNKHLYFFDAPEDIPAPKIRIHQQQVEKKKNYNIIFIKAPAYQAPHIQIPAAQQQSAEKTLVYVLVKKPEDVKNIEIPSIGPTKPTKPEVFFIKYKTQKEAQEKIEHIQNGGSGDGIVSTDLGSDTNFVNTIRDGSASDNIISIGSGPDSGSTFDQISTVTGTEYETGHGGHGIGPNTGHSSSGSFVHQHQPDIISQSGPY